MLSKIIFTLQIMSPQGHTDGIERHLEQETLNQTALVCKKMTVQTALVCKKMTVQTKALLNKLKPTTISFRQDSPDGSLTPEEIQSPKGFPCSSWIENSMETIQNKTINTIASEHHDGTLLIKPFRKKAEQDSCRNAIMVNSEAMVISPSINEHNIHNGYLEQALKQLTSYKTPNPQELACMNYVTRKTWECSTEGNNAVMNWIKKTGVEPTNAQPQDFAQALVLMEQNPEVKKCVKLMVPELKKQNYYTQLKQCYGKQDRTQDQEELTQKLYAVAGLFTLVDPRNIFRKTFSMDILGVATVLAGHPKFGEETNSEL